MVSVKGVNNSLLAGELCSSACQGFRLRLLALQPMMSSGVDLVSVSVFTRYLKISKSNGLFFRFVCFTASKH